MKNRPIVLDGGAWLALVKQRSDRRNKRATPLRWHTFLDELSINMTNDPISRFNWKDALYGGKWLMASGLSPEVFFAAALGRGLVYLCWGLPTRSAWKNALMKFVLSRAEKVLVNDGVTKHEVQALSGRDAVIVPYFIDTDFFAYRLINARKRFVFCPGSNDRDPEVLLGLAACGHDVIWLVNDKTLWDTHADRHPRLNLRSNVSFDKLRSLYQTCEVVVMPALRDRHAAGQTTGLEAIACGAPLLISQGRTASIFADFPSAFTLIVSAPQAWSQAIHELRVNDELCDMTQTSATLVRQRISKHNVGNVLSSVLG